MLLVTNCPFYLQVCTSKMNLGDEDKISAAGVSALPSIRLLNILEICTLTTAT